jgi:GNAT superfamily N-acetyltransferase
MIKLEVVETPKQKREFLEFAKRLYKGNRYWVCPLDDDIERRFDPARNELFNDGAAVRWLAKDIKGHTVGRIAAFYNRPLAALNDQPTGSCGFFECVNDQKVADMLFDAARDWLAAQGMEAMDGPVNFGDRDEWWGLLVDGFELQPLYANPYNPPYYKELFENYGFKNYFNQYTYARNLTIGELSPSVYERVKRLEETPGYRFTHIKKSELDQVAHDFRLIYNKSWARFPGVKAMDEAHAAKLMKTLKPIIDEKLIYFAYFNDEPIGFYIMVPDLNRVIGRFNGKLNIVNKIRLMWMLKLTKKADRVFGIIFGVTPEFQGKGIESGIIHAFEQAVARGEVNYKSLELAWMGDFNPVMIRMVENYVCATKLKTHVTYRYLFDQTKEFHRCPRLSAK